MKASDPQVKLRYLQGNISLRELAQETGVSFSTIGKKASAEGWEKQRTQFCNKVETKVIEKKADAIAEMNFRQLADSKSLQNICRELIAKVTAHFKNANYTDNSEALAAFRAAATALVEAQKQERLILGEPTERSETNANVSLTDREYSRFGEVLGAFAGSN